MEWIYEMKSILSDNKHIRCFKINRGEVRKDLDDNHYFEFIFSYYYKINNQMRKGYSYVWLCDSKVVKIENKIWNRFDEFINIFIQKRWLMVYNSYNTDIDEDIMFSNQTLINSGECFSFIIEDISFSDLLDDEIEERVFNFDEIIVDYYSNLYFGK
jgi:hypothetical protein